MTIQKANSTIHCEHIRRRTVSKFEPSTYDMCSIGSFPLNLEWNEDALQIPASSLEYLRSQLPDSSEFEEYVTDLLAQSGCTLHFASFCGNTTNAAARVTANGGCKVLSVMAMTVNPWSMTMDSGHSLMTTFPSTDPYYQCNADYILVETAAAKGQLWW